ncbi:hypothetical protein, partial [Burkholderia multivorans]|uniref:hypothetical protein n=1 Tax=Burkholderia multivorans TaxID=87883 RepID=UPI001C65F93C
DELAQPCGELERSEPGTQVRALGVEDGDERLSPARTDTDDGTAGDLTVRVDEGLESARTDRSLRCRDDVLEAALEPDPARIVDVPDVVRPVPVLPAEAVPPGVRILTVDIDEEGCRIADVV